MHISRCVFSDLILKLKKLLPRYRHPTIDHRSLEPTKMNPRIKIEATHYATPQLQRVQRRRWSKLSWTQACPNASAGIVGCSIEQMSSPGTCGGLGPFRHSESTRSLTLAPLCSMLVAILTASCDIGDSTLEVHHVVEDPLKSPTSMSPE